MAIARRVTQVYAGPTAAGQILAPTINVGLGVPAAMAGTFSVSGVFGGDSVSGTTVYQGFRVVQSMDLSARRYVVFGAAHDNLSRINLETFANGGLRIVFQDGSGNWASYHFFGSGLNDFGVAVDGAFGSFVGFGNGADFSQGPPQWIIDRNRPANQSSGSLNWSNITAFEVHFRPRSSGRMQLAVGLFSNAESPLHTGTVSGNGFLGDVRGAYGSPGSGLYPILWAGRNTSFYAAGSPQIIESYLMGFDVGDGSTTTALNVANRGHVLWSTPEDFSVNNPVPNAVVLVQDPRLIRINQSATDNVTYTDCLFASTSRWGVEVTGNTAGTCVFTRCQFWRYETFVANHAQFIDCQFSEASAPVEVNGTTVILDGVIRDATTTALRVNTGPAIYDDLRLRFNNPSATADIELGSGGAGTYELPNISVPDGYTLKIRNNSATNAITVAIPTGIAFSTSTAGGTITVQTPSVTANGQITGIFAGSRLQVFNETTNTEVFNDIVAGTSYSNTYTEGTTFSAGDIVRVRLAWHSGAVAKVPVQYRTVATANGWAILADQQDDVVYNQNAIDGDAVLEFIEDFPNVEIDIDDPDGVTTVQRGYAWYVAGQLTPDGIRFFHGGMTAEDDVNYRVNVDVVDMKIQNINANPVRVIGGRLYRSDGTTVIRPGGGGVQMDYGRAYAVETGVSGLTAAESDRLMQTALQTTAQEAARNAALAAALSA